MKIICRLIINVLDIKLIDNQVSNQISNVPYPSFTMGIVASHGPGKTTLLTNMLMKKEFFKDKLNQIVILSPTYKNNINKWDFVCSKTVLVENKMDCQRKRIMLKHLIKRTSLIKR